MGNLSSVNKIDIIPEFQAFLLEKKMRRNRIASLTLPFESRSNLVKHQTYYE